MMPPLANVGVPMIFVTLPAMIYLILPVIGIEFLAARRSLEGQPTGRKWLGLTVANLVSTFVGWPIAWGFLVCLQMITDGGRAYRLDTPLRAFLSVTQQAAWLIPYQEHLYWMVPTAMAVLLVPFFFVSVFLERWILRFIWKPENVADLNRFVWRAHFFSYGFLVVVLIGYAVVSIRGGPSHQ